MRRALTKKGEKGAAARGPTTYRGHGFFSATWGLSKISCDTASRRGAPALSSLDVLDLVFLEAPPSSSPSNSLFECSLSLFFLENQTGKKEAKQQFDLRLVDYYNRLMPGEDDLVEDEQDDEDRLPWYLVTRKRRQVLNKICEMEHVEKNKEAEKKFLVFRRAERETCLDLTSTPSTKLTTCSRTT